MTDQLEQPGCSSLGSLGWFNIRDYPTLNAAVSAVDAAGGGVLYIPPGIHSVGDPRDSVPTPQKPSRHLPTVAPVRCNFRATSELLIPCPQLSTIRARIAMACADFGRRAIMINFSRSSTAISRGFLGRPVRIPKHAPRCRFLQRISRSAH